MADYSVPSSNKLDESIVQDLDATSATAVHNRGMRVKSSDGKEFVYVYMESAGVTTYAGRPMVWVDTTGYYVVNADASVGKDTDPMTANGFAGIAASQSVADNNMYLWIQTRGWADSVLVSTAVAVNSELVILDDDALDCVTTYHTSATSTHYRIIGKAMTAAAAGVTSLHSTASIILY